jgi:hypothetical protein
VRIIIAGGIDMTGYRSLAIPTEEAVRFRRAEKDDFDHRVERLTSERTYPCRHFLRQASAKNGMLPFSDHTHVLQDRWDGVSSSVILAPCSGPSRTAWQHGSEKQSQRSDHP